MANARNVVRCSIFHPTFLQAVLYLYSMHNGVLHTTEYTCVHDTAFTMYFMVYGFIWCSGFQNTERNKIKKQFVNLGVRKCFLYFCIRCVGRTIKNMCSHVLLSLVSLHEVGPMKGYDCRLRYYLFLMNETEKNTYNNISFKDDVTVVQ